MKKSIQVLRANHGYQKLDEQQGLSYLVQSVQENDPQKVISALANESRNDVKASAFAEALQSRKWKALLVLLQNGVYHGHLKGLQKATKWIDSTKIELVGSLIKTLIDQTADAQLSVDEVADLRELLVEVAELDRTIIAHWKVSECSNLTARFNLSNVLSHRYIHLFQAIEIPAACMLFSQIRESLRVHHYRLLTHGAGNEDFLINSSRIATDDVHAKFFFESSLKNFGMNKDGCRDLFYTVYMRCQLQVRGPNFEENARRVYQSPAYVKTLANPPKIAVLSIIEEGSKDSKTTISAFEKQQGDSYLSV